MLSLLGTCLVVANNMTTSEMTQAKHIQSNPSARIGFVLSYPFQYFIYKNIYKHIYKVSEFIVDLGSFYPKEQPTELLMEIVSLLQKEGVHYKILYYEDYLYRKYLDSFFSKYDLLVGVWERGCINLPATAILKKVGVTYGAGKELTFVRSSQSIYDITLDYGERSATLHSYFSNPVITGNAKFDDWFNNTLNKKQITELEERLDPQKKTLLYLPTHGDLSSVDILAEKLESISDMYNIIVKLHYYITREEPERVALLSNKKFLLYNDDTDLLPLLKKADAVISDNSSVIFDTILADKPILVADFWDDTFFNEDHRELKEVPRGIAGALTFSESIEQEIKRQNQVVTLKKNESLSTKILETLEDTEEMSSNRKLLREKLFSFNDGNCGRRGADVILKLLESEEKPNKTILYQAWEVSKKNQGNLSRFERQKLLDEISLYKNEELRALDSPFFSVILIPENGATTISSSLRGLVEQNYSEDNYEIVILNKNDGDILTNIFSQKNIRLEPYENLISFGEVISKAIKNTNGSIICFTTSDCVVPSDWLLRLSTLYKKNKNISGCGGTIIYTQNKFLNYFYLHEVSKKLGILSSRYMMSNLFSISNQLPFLNPMGSLSNTSYKKESLLNISLKGRTLGEIEIIMRLKASQHGTLYFDPSSVQNIENKTWREFLNKQISYGYALYRTQEEGGYDVISYSPLKIVAEGLTQLSLGLHLENIKLTSIIFLVATLRFLGISLGFLIRQLLLLKVIVEDSIKIS